MISACNQNMAADEITLVGSDFVSKFYATFTGKPDACAFRQFFDECSTFTFVQHCGRADYRMTGVDTIAEFADRMQYDQCTATVRSVTTTRVRPTWFKIAAVCDLSRRPDVPCKFFQSIVIRRVAWTRAEFVVVDTSFEFDDRLLQTVDDDVIPKPMSSLLDRLRAAHVHNVTRNTEECSADIVRTFSRKPTYTAAATDGRRLKKSNSARCTDTHSRKVRTAIVCSGAATENPSVPKHRSTVIAAVKPTTTNDESKSIIKNPKTIHQQPTALNDKSKDRAERSRKSETIKSNNKNVTKCESKITGTAQSPSTLQKPTPICKTSRIDTSKIQVKKLKKIAENPMANYAPKSCTPEVPNRDSKLKSVSKRATVIDSPRKSSPARIDIGNEQINTAVLSKKVTGKSSMKIQSAVGKNAQKIESMTPKTLLTGKKQAIVFEKKQNGRQSEKQKDITRQAKESNYFISTNSFRPLAVDVDFVSHSGSDIQINPKNCAFLDNEIVREIVVPLVLTADAPVRKDTLITSNGQSKNSRKNGKKNKKMQNVSNKLKQQSKSEKCQSTTHFFYISVVLNYVRDLLKL